MSCYCLFYSGSFYLFSLIFILNINFTQNNGNNVILGEWRGVLWNRNRDNEIWVLVAVDDEDSDTWTEDNTTLMTQGNLCIGHDRSP